MPVTYEIDQTGVIRTRCVGDVRFAEVLAHFDELERDPRCPPHLDVLLDLSELDSIPESDQLRVVAERIGKASPRVRFGACAVVVSRTVVYGMARVVETFAESYFTASHVFWKLTDAEEWLEAQRSSGKA